MVLLINLESAQVRRAAMTSRLAEQRLRHERVDVDMRHLSRDEVTARCAPAFPTLAFDLGPGPTVAAILQFNAKGVAPWIDEQLELNVARYRQPPSFDPPMDPTRCVA